MVTGAAPVVSIALSMHNAGPTIGAALLMLRAQTLADWELILLDDGSIDDGLDVVRRFTDARIRVFSDGKRLGLAARLNQAIDAAHGRYLARMDADDIAYPERLAKQCAFLNRHMDVDLVGTGMMVFAGNGRIVGAYPAHTTHEAICARPYSGFHLAHPSWMGRIEWFRRWRYDPACIKAQDQNLLLRAYRSSRFAALPELLVGYRQDRVSVKKSALGRWYFSRAIWRAAREERDIVRGAAAVGMQAVKLGYDVLASTTGLERHLLKHRALKPSKAEVEQWTEVWKACQEHTRHLSPSPGTGDGSYTSHAGPLPQREAHGWNKERP